MKWGAWRLAICLLASMAMWAQAGQNSNQSGPQSQTPQPSERPTLGPRSGPGIMDVAPPASATTDLRRLLRIRTIYIESIDNPANKDFQKRFRAKYGADYPPITDLAMSSYQGMHLWAAGVKKAGTIDREKVIEALESGISIDGPSGKVTLDPATHHVTFDVHLSVLKDKQIKLIETFSQRPPADTAAVCDLKKNPRDAKQYIIKAN